MATREMTAEEAKQELEVAHTALIGTVEELEGHGLHSATIVEALIGLAVQFAVRDWGREEAKAILNDALKARLLPPPSYGLESRLSAVIHNETMRSTQRISSHTAEVCPRGPPPTWWTPTSIRMSDFDLVERKVPAPVKVRLKRVNCEWWHRLKNAFGTASKSAFVGASLQQLIAAARHQAPR